MRNPCIVDLYIAMFLVWRACWIVHPLHPIPLKIQYTYKVHEGAFRHSEGTLTPGIYTVKILISAQAAINFRRALDPSAIGDRRLLEDIIRCIFQIQYPRTPGSY